ncbi:MULTISPECIES: hypothetical protein [unclassified Neptuniibacter]|uniref:AbiTii domain-containing protein n=1 Tax=unclassified Neptuniibacter TaxID=2630693 RepID=UPI0025D371F9|nr:MULTISPECIES: hypothetical protein [unclassified Neptuniibacter]|tara:strand:+ start:1584 stop:2483 length:900 start_codon:yes stop_codon:yes gene_type:complete
MNSPIVVQLQELASDSTNHLPDLLRKALLISSKLGLDEFRFWVLSELNGYESEADIPDYRTIGSQLKVINPYHGYQPFIIEDGELAALVSNVKIFESVESLQHLILSPNKKEQLTFPFPAEQKAALMRMQGGIAQLEPTRIIGKNQVKSVLEQVRTRLLDWALLLESQGILGDGLNFSAKEKAIANENQSAINIQNFQGVLGNVSGGNVSQTMSLTVTSGNFDSLANYFRGQDVTEDDIQSLELAVSQDPEATEPGSFGPKVSGWIGKMTSKAANGSWAVSVGAAGSLLATAIAKFYGI